MLAWFKNASDETSFRLAWLRRKSIEKSQRWAELLEQYPAEALEREVRDRERLIIERFRSKHKGRKKFYDDSIRMVGDRQRELKRIRKLMLRDYDYELQKFYMRKEEIKRRHQSIKSESSDAFRRLKSAKADVDAWYRKSKRSGLLLGNQGKKIPQHSIFGQSFGDLDAAKARLNEARDDIGNLKNEKERLSAEFNRLDEKIQYIRDRQQERRQLETQGYTPSVLEVEIAQLSEKSSQLALRSKATQRQLERMLKRELERNSIDQDKQRAKDMRKQRKAELASFMADGSVLCRKESFRNEWYRSRKNVV